MKIIKEHSGQAGALGGSNYILPDVFVGNDHSWRVDETLYS